MGPQHPSTHGVLRLILEIDGETVTEARCGIGYLHTGIEKNMEFRTWVQGVTYVTRMDYLTSMFNEVAYCLAVEKALGVTDQIPERASIIRVMMMELNRISSHLVALATGGLELGALTAMEFGFRERELVLDIFEMVSGLRMNHAYIRPGGVAQDLPEDGVQKIRETIPLLRKRLKDTVALLVDNTIWMGRTVGVGLPRPHRLHGAGHHGPRASGHRAAARPAQEPALLRLRELRVRRLHGDDQRRVRPLPHQDRRDGAVAADRRAVPGPRSSPGPS